MTYDTVIIGGGPAAASAALTLRARNKTVAVVSGGIDDIPLSRSARIANYPGAANLSGRELLEAMERQTAEAGAVMIRGRATSVVDMGSFFGVAVEADFCQGKTVILCTGVKAGDAFPGEKELLGRGVSYCVTCDGMLYRGKDVALLGFTSDAAAEAALLESMGCRVRLFTDKKTAYAIEGEKRVAAVRAGDEVWPCEGVFILRRSTAPDSLLAGLAMEGPHIRVDREMGTSVGGVFAAGDCTGRPYQVAKAVGDGNIAALSAAKYLEAADEENSKL